MRRRDVERFAGGVEREDAEDAHREGHAAQVDVHAPGPSALHRELRASLGQ